MIANQIWLLAEDVAEVMQDQAIAHYVLKDEVKGHNHPGTSGILYVNLEKLSQEQSIAGELAACLLGKPITPRNGDVKKISKAIKTSFERFKSEKDVVTMFSFQERWIAEGEAKGILEAAIKMIRNGFDFKLVVETLQLSESEIAQLENMIA